MSRLAQITIVLIISGLLTFYILPDLIAIEQGCYYFIWAKLVDILLLWLVVLFLKGKRKAIRAAFKGLLIFFIIRLAWQILALKMGYDFASQNLIMLCLLTLILTITTIIILIEWRQSKRSGIR